MFIKKLIALATNRMTIKVAIFNLWIVSAKSRIVREHLTSQLPWAAAWLLVTCGSPVYPVVGESRPCSVAPYDSFVRRVTWLCVICRRHYEMWENNHTHFTATSVHNNKLTMSTKHFWGKKICEKKVNLLN